MLTTAFRTARLLSSHSSTISQSLSNLTASERGRRVTYRSTFSGKLPWEVRGLGAGTEEIVLPFDVELKYGAEDLPELGREALDCSLFASLDDRTRTHTKDGCRNSVAKDLCRS